MKHLLSLLIISLIGFNSFGQCLYGLEHYPDTTGTNSIVIIHKYGFPTGVQHRMNIPPQWSFGGLDTTFLNNNSDTLSFSFYTDTIGWFQLFGTTPAGDTLSIMETPALAFPELLTLKRYTPPTTVSSADGVIVFNKQNNGYSTIDGPINATVQEYPDSSVFSGLSQGPFHACYFETIDSEICIYGMLGDPFIWSDFYADSITCPIGINMASNTSVCDGEAYVASVQNGVAPYTFDWNLNGVFTNDTLDTLLCVGNHMVIIKDQNDQTRNCAFSIGSLDNSYIPPAQSYDTIIHNYTEYCIDPDVDSVSLIGSEFIDSISASIVWSFYDDSLLVDQLLDTINFSVPNPTYTNISIYLHLTCNGDTLKSTESVFSVAGYLPYPFTETGTLGNSGHNLLEVMLYPNPTKNILNIRSQQKLREVVFINSLGAIEKRVNKISSSIDISDLNKGIYFVHIYDINGNKYTRRLIKN